MSSYESRKHVSQSRVSDGPVEDHFLVDLENKITTLKNISTNMHDELKGSKLHVSSLRDGFDTANRSVRLGLSNMSKLMSRDSIGLSMTKTVTLTVISLIILFFIFRRLFGLF